MKTKQKIYDGKSLANDICKLIFKYMQNGMQANNVMACLAANAMAIEMINSKPSKKAKK